MPSLEGEDLGVLTEKVFEVLRLEYEADPLAGQWADEVLTMIDGELLQSCAVPTKI